MKLLWREVSDGAAAESAPTCWKVTEPMRSTSWPGRLRFGSRCRCRRTLAGHNRASRSLLRAK